MELESLLVKINSGKALVQSEIEEVAALLQWIHEDKGVAARVSIDDVYGMLLVIGRARSEAHKHLLASYFESRDALTVGLVLEILCLEWKVTGEYLERVINFALGVPWDTEEDVRQAALKVLGEYLHERLPAMRHGKSPVAERERKVLELLIAVFDDNEVSRWTRQVAYYSLCRSAGKPWEEIPSEYRELDFSERSADLDHEMLASLRALIT